MRALIASALVLASTVAHAERRFEVEPTRVDLSTSTPAGSLTVHNRGGEGVRLQVTVARWHEDGDGAMRLEPAPEVVVRPAIFELEPNRSRTIRVGTTATSGALEGSYRIFVEELPDRRTKPTAQIQVLTRIGVPVFVAPTSPRVALTATTKLEGARAMVAVRNSGTKHAKLAKVTVEAVRGGKPRWQREAMGWYVLATTERRFPVELRGEQCQAGDRLAVTLTDEDGTVTSSQQSCGD